MNDFLVVVGRFALAAAFGAAIGFDRERRAKPAGLRTNMVVAVATAAFSYTGAELFGGGDPTRVASQVVSGIGFLGGGVIFAAGGKPHGITTAAALWAAAAVGVATGLGAFAVGAALTLIVVVVLWPLDRLVFALFADRVRRSVQVQIVVDDLRQLGQIREAFDAFDVRTLEMELTQIGDNVVADALLVGRPDQLAQVEAQVKEQTGLPMMLRRGGPS